MKRGSFRNWLFWIVILCFTTSVISQEKELPQTSESAIVKERVKHTLTISKYLQFSDEYSTFVKVLKESDVFSHLNSGKEFTIFAPGNSAFAQMPANVIDELFKKENHVKLKSIAEYHVVNSILNLDDALFKMNGSTNIVAMNNEIIQVTVGAEDMILIQDANNYPIDVMEKIELSNGIIYRIDAVLLPQVDVRMVLR